MTTVRLVTGYVPIPGHPRTPAEYREAGSELMKARVPVRAFEARLADCWLHRMIAGLPYEVTHSRGDNPDKNTLAYHAVNHQKTAWLLQEAREDREADVLVWVDYGIMRLPGMSAEVLEAFAAAVAAAPPRRVTIPGCWERGPVSDAFPCWRFCGAVLICPREDALRLDLAVRARAWHHVEATRNVAWEVNTWARVELSGDVPIAWYRANHDATLFTSYPSSPPARDQAPPAAGAGAPPPAARGARDGGADRRGPAPPPRAPAGGAISIYSINYDNPRREPQPVGGIARSFVAGLSDRDGDTIADRDSYADARAMYWVWKNAPLDIVGFHGYRKHIDFRGDATGWTAVSLPAFRAYQEWLAGWDGADVVSLLRQCDIIVTSPYRCAAGEDMTSDFQRSRSPRDWAALQEVMGGGFEYRLPYIHNMFFVTTAPLFRAYMRFWWGVCQRLEPLVTSEDATDPAYRARAMAYLSERIFGMWLHRSGLAYVELPLLICWDAH